MFFSKKYFLTDVLEGCIDIHNHILPAIDDGSPDLDTTSEMLQLYKDLGFDGVYSTPHTMEDYYSNDASKISSKFNETVSQLGNDKNIAILKATASEYMMDGAFEELLDTSNYLTLPGNHLLFEFSYFQKPIQAEELVFKMQQLDLLPILAHPERYRYLKIKDILEFKNRGCKLQLNLLSLSGHYGDDALKKSTALLLDGHYDFIATDAHKPAHLLKIKETKVKEMILNPLRSIVDQQADLF